MIPLNGTPIYFSNMLPPGEVLQVGGRLYVRDQETANKLMEQMNAPKEARMHPAEAAFLQAILAAPDDDTPRLVYADWLEENGLSSRCKACGGSGVGSRSFLPDVGYHGCPGCRGTGRVSDGRAERAEFIRVQCRIAEIDAEVQSNEDCDSPGCPSCVERRPLRRRERELLDAHREEWFRLLSRRPGFGENEPLRWWPVASNEEEVADRGPGCPVLSAAIEGTPRRGFVEKITCTAADWLAHGRAVVACQPVREVTLTTPFIVPPPSDYGRTAIHFLEDNWPGIRFTLPPPPIEDVDWSGNPVA